MPCACARTLPGKPRAIALKRLGAVWAFWVCPKVAVFEKWCFFCGVLEWCKNGGKQRKLNINEGVGLLFFLRSATCIQVVFMCEACRYGFEFPVGMFTVFAFV